MKQYDDNNIFAKILRKELKATFVCEDENIAVIMDAMPQSKGHMLVIPKVKARNILDIPPEYLPNLILQTQKIAKIAKDKLNADGISIFQFNEPDGGQTVFHLHFHVVPRYKNIELKTHARTFADPDELENIAKIIRQAL
ncbi:HIT family protein [Bartonella sp. DGB1]|uniref:HIT family protein n=1 Tax=Bartonella sp. DGB1 TaxID=3239807 RepID=UPI0035264281